MNFSKNMGEAFSKGVGSMNITISARNTSVRDSFKERVEKKLSKFDRFFNDAKAFVTVTNEGERETVEVTIKAERLVFRAEKTTSDRIDSLESVCDLLFRQIVKNKSKLESRLKSGAYNAEYDDAPYQPEEYQVVRTKRFPVKPMEVEEAILQMNMLGHSFFVYRNVNSNEVNVVYKRNNGAYGVIEAVEDEE